jgi:nucleotide-binding universal stress UspA family protein
VIDTQHYTESLMFKKILIPIDGSKEASAAGQFAIDLARSCGASAVALHVAPPFQMPYFEDFVRPPDTTRDQWQTGLRNAAERRFQLLKDAARDAGVPFSAECVFAENAAEAVVAAAKSYGCDLIVMGPRGRGGVADYLLGSVTARVLGGSNVSTLVHRAPSS